MANDVDDGSKALEDDARPCSGVPLVNYPGWLLLVAGVAAAHGRLFGGENSAGRLPALLLLPPYVAAAWAARRHRFRYLIFSAPFPVAFGASL